MNEQTELPRGMQAGPAPVPMVPEAAIDEMGVFNPTVDISPFIEYKFYKCQNPACGRRDFAGGMDTALETPCSYCVLIPASGPKGKAVHGTMKLMLFKKPRPGVRQPENDPFVSEAPPTPVKVRVDPATNERL